MLKLIDIKLMGMSEIILKSNWGDNKTLDKFEILSKISLQLYWLKKRNKIQVDIYSLYDFIKIYFN